MFSLHTSCTTCFALMIRKISSFYFERGHRGLYTFRSFLCMSSSPVIYLIFYFLMDIEFLSFSLSLCFSTQAISLDNILTRFFLSFITFGRAFRYLSIDRLWMCVGDDELLAMKVGMRWSSFFLTNLFVISRLEALHYVLSIKP